MTSRTFIDTVRRTSFSAQRGIESKAVARNPDARGSELAPIGRPQNDEVYPILTEFPGLFPRQLLIFGSSPSLRLGSSISGRERDQRIGSSTMHTTAGRFNPGLVFAQVGYPARTTQQPRYPPNLYRTIILGIIGLPSIPLQDERSKGRRPPDDWGFGSRRKRKEGSKKKILLKRR